MELLQETYEGLELRSDVYTREAERDFVLGLGPSAEVLARATIRRRVTAALDLGTGSGIHALLAARHAERVVGTDVNPRALDIARLNAGANGIDNVEWREGDWLEPVRGERFDLVVANPPYVISPAAELTYRDSGEESDALVLRLLSQIPEVLAEGGFAQVLCNWTLGEERDWRGPLERAVTGRGCDAVLLRFREQEPEDYAKQWHRRLATVDPERFRKTVAHWVDYYRGQRIAAIASGLVVLRRRTVERNWVRALQVPAAPTEGAGEHVVRLFEGWDWARTGRRNGIALELAPGSRVVRRLDLADGAERITLEVRPNVGFAARIDSSVADALARREPLPHEHARRLVGLGLLLTQEKGSWKIAPPELERSKE